MVLMVATLSRTLAPETESKNIKIPVTDAGWETGNIENK